MIKTLPNASKKNRMSYFRIALTLFRIIVLYKNKCQIIILISIFSVSILLALVLKYVPWKVSWTKFSICTVNNWIRVFMDISPPKLKGLIVCKMFAICVKEDFPKLQDTWTTVRKGSEQCTIYLPVPPVACS